MTEQQQSSASSAFGMEPERSLSQPAPGQYGKASGPRAGFWRRWAAYVLDTLVAVVIFLILYLVLKGAGIVIGLVLLIAYFIVLEGGETGQTLGKKAMGIRVVSLSDGGPIGYGRATIRFFGRYVSQLLIGLPLGYLWMLWDKEKQTWHDKFADDVVVPIREYPI